MCLSFRQASANDTPLLARMNQALLRDEANKQDLTLEYLETRMYGFLAADYSAVLFYRGDQACGFALYRDESDFVYLRQFFIAPAYRRQGLGRAALDWLAANSFAHKPRLRIEVLAHNQRGLDFWHAVGFADYFMTMEKSTPP